MAILQWSKLYLIKNFPSFNCPKKFGGPYGTPNAFGVRVPGLPVRDRTGGCNNRGHARPQMSAVNVTRKVVLWAFVFSSRNGHIWALSQLFLCTHNSDLSLYNYFLIFVRFFFHKWSPIFLVIKIHQAIWPSPGTLFGVSSKSTLFFSWRPFQRDERTMWERQCKHHENASTVIAPRPANKKRRVRIRELHLGRALAICTTRPEVQGPISKGIFEKGAKKKIESIWMRHRRGYRD